MSISEKDAILRERAAFLHGWLRQFGTNPKPTTRDTEMAAEAYPFPRVTRPRVVRDPQGTSYGPASGFTGPLHWSVRDGFLIPVTGDGTFVSEWEEDQRRDSYPTPNRVRVWANLLANPTEEVEDVA